MYGTLDKDEGHGGQVVPAEMHRMARMDSVRMFGGGADDESVTHTAPRERGRLDADGLRADDLTGVQQRRGDSYDAIENVQG